MRNAGGIDDTGFGLDYDSKGETVTEPKLETQNKSLFEEMADLEKRRQHRIGELQAERAKRKKDHVEALKAIDSELERLAQRQPRKPRAPKAAKNGAAAK